MEGPSLSVHIQAKSWTDGIGPSIVSLLARLLLGRRYVFSMHRIP